MGFDTSNYTTSAAAYISSSGDMISRKKLLPVKEGEKGLRQSDALFHHVRQLPETYPDVLSLGDFSACAVSARPRNLPGSYMPCFLAGKTLADGISKCLGIPLYETSHQVGHVLAALYSSKKTELLYRDSPFIAFHLSGGTTDCILCTPDPDEIITCRELFSSSDLKAGQAVDRVGLMLGLRFPCGPDLEKLAEQSDRIFKIKPAVKDGCPSFSGLENKCREMLKKGESACDIALYCIKYIETSLIAMTEAALGLSGDLPLVYAGGVMSNKIIKNAVIERFEAYFAEPEFSSDNACGIALYAALKSGLKV